MTDEKIAGWDQYWAHGFLTSCADAFRGNYEGAMRGTWETAFSALPAGSRILDVATGNGAIALIAAATARDQGKKFSIDAFDLARIDPHKATARQHRELLDDIRFHPRVDAAALPFADAEFDFVCGHFALEYTAVERAVAELDRVCDKQAAGLFVMHHANSVILQTTAEEKRHLALLDETALFEHAGAFIDLVGSTAPKMRAHLQTLPHAEQLRTALNTA
ncbi:MAG: class I SAM-dependent methyltransferase, partial [Gammaproteobacteria bacterium]|nr:class I SAM-dependent methyltransferase [Gammaproteobacteria bacterium]